MLIKLNN